MDDSYSTWIANLIAGTVSEQDQSALEQYRTSRNAPPAPRLAGRHTGADAPQNGHAYQPRHVTAGAGQASDGLVTYNVANAGW